MWLLLLLTMGMGALGFVDDYLKHVQKSPKGLCAKYKFLVQFILGLAFAIYLYLNPTSAEYPTALNLPFVNEPSIHLGPLYILFVTLVVVGTSNAVNLTDGLDGLAIGAFIFAALSYCGMSYLAGHYKFAHYLKIIYIPKAGEVTVFLGALIGASLGFLWFNAYPAQIFMGDTGALAIGALLGASACLIKQELLLLIVGGLFVFETLSVIIQVLSFKLLGKRIFKMAPVHHHFEMRGWPEPRIIVRFWIIAGVLALLTLSTLKIR
jgi:phospho-N-acetylmuramoyl-pentapeptide-transferase